MSTILSSIAAVFILVSPLWVALHAARKDKNKLATIIYVSYLLPFLPFIIAIFAFFIVRPDKPNYSYIPNPKVMIGIGTKFIGAYDRRPDGSFITAEWFVLFFIPLIPLMAYRVSFGGSQTKTNLAQVTTLTQYHVYECIPLNPVQILKPYCFIASIFVFAAIILQSSTASKSMAQSTLTGLLVIYVIIAFFLFKAK